MNKWKLDPATFSGRHSITGMCSAADYPTYSIYQSAPPTPPKPREWVNGDNKVWVVTVEYRKPSLGDAGVLGTFRTCEKAKAFLSKWADDRRGRGATKKELADGAIYSEDYSVEIVEEESK